VTNINKSTAMNPYIIERSSFAMKGSPHISLQDTYIFNRYCDSVPRPMVIPEHRFILIIIAKDGHEKS
jgi:hypothetical protein